MMHAQTHIQIITPSDVLILTTTFAEGEQLVSNPNPKRTVPQPERRQSVSTRLYRYLGAMAVVCEVALSWMCKCCVCLCLCCVRCDLVYVFARVQCVFALCAVCVI